MQQQDNGELVTGQVLKRKYFTNMTVMNASHSMKAGKNKTTSEFYKGRLEYAGGT